MKEPSLETYFKFLYLVHKFGQYGYADYPQISNRLQPYSTEDLQNRKASWHINCYATTCNIVHLNCAKARYLKACEEGESELLQKGRGRPPSAPVAESSLSGSSSENWYTRSLAAAISADLCFFCQKETKYPLHEVSSFNAGQQLREAVQESNNQQWKVQLSAAISSDDARAIDVKYHLKCWVQNVQRRKKRCDEAKELPMQEANVGIVASDIEFASLVLDSGPEKSSS